MHRVILAFSLCHTQSVCLPSSSRTPFGESPDTSPNQFFPTTPSSTYHVTLYWGQGWQTWKRTPLWRIPPSTGTKRSTIHNSPIWVSLDNPYLSSKYYI